MLGFFLTRFFITLESTEKDVFCYSRHFIHTVNAKRKDKWKPYIWIITFWTRRTPVVLARARGLSPPMCRQPVLTSTDLPPPPPTLIKIHNYILLQGHRLRIWIVILRVIFIMIILFQSFYWHSWIIKIMWSFKGRGWGGVCGMIRIFQLFRSYQNSINSTIIVNGGIFAENT